LNPEEYLSRLIVWIKQPSDRFTGFTLSHTIAGSEFYVQGSSLQFEIAAGADLTDGVQVTELKELSNFTLPSPTEPNPLLSAVTGSSSNPVFIFNGREIQGITGFSRFHPALLVLNSDGTG